MFKLNLQKEMQDQKLTIHEGISPLLDEIANQTDLVNNTQEAEPKFKEVTKSGKIVLSAISKSQKHPKYFNKKLYLYLPLTNKEKDGLIHDGLAYCEESKEALVFSSVEEAEAENEKIKNYIFNQFDEKKCHILGSAQLQVEII